MVGPITFRNSIERARGFTIVELSIVIAIIGSLAAISFAYIPSALTNARNSERISDIKSLARYFEQRYREQASSAYPSYPSTSSFSTEMNLLMNGGLKEAAIAPRQTTNSVTVAASNGDLSAVVTAQGYIYQPFSPDGTLCTASSANSPCTRFKIWYMTEATTPVVRVVESRYQQ
jgi:prepilin-type N-terminal cleavage/methylation domain-containing protein